MPARKIKGHWYVDFRFRGTRVRRRSPEDSRKGAVAFEAILRAELLNPGPPPLPDPKFGDFVERWYRTCVLTNNKYSEQCRKRYVLDAHLLPNFGTTRLSGITSRKVEEFKATLVERGKAPKTINNIVGVMRTALRCAREWKEVDEIPHMRPMRVGPQRFDSLTPHEAASLLQHCDRSIRPMVQLALQSGLRFGELTALRWSDLDLVQRVLAVRRAVYRGRLGSPKSNRERKVPLTDAACRALRSMARVNELVFVGPSGGYVRHGYARKELHRACKRSGLRTVGWHCLRHTYASTLASRGVPLYVIQQLLGHSTVQMTERYAHLLPKTMHEAVALLEGAPESSLGTIWATHPVPRSLSNGAARVGGLH